MISKAGPKIKILKSKSLKFLWFHNNFKKDKNKNIARFVFRIHFFWAMDDPLVFSFKSEENICLTFV